jgi:ABC-type multidrug transport system ATPase subunit
MTAAPGLSNRSFLEVHGLEKRFGGVHALRGVDIDIRAAEVHGLVGANGAGKSTLIRILAGVETPHNVWDVHVIEYARNNRRAGTRCRARPFADHHSSRCNPLGILPARL